MQPGKLFLCSTLLLCISIHASSQSLLKKLKQKVESTTEKVIDKKDQREDWWWQQWTRTTRANESSRSGGSSSGNNSNTTGEGLVTVPPDVNKFLTEADEAFKKNDLSDSRYSLQQAMLGVEMEIGKKILNDLPMTIKSLKKDTTAGKVTSTGWGWVGLMIQANYKNEKQELNIDIANNAMWMQAINAYLTNGAYSQSNGEQQNWKQTKLKGYRAVIEFDKNSGYKLSVPLGQTSLIIFQGINFATEAEMMDACSVVDIDSIKQELGENNQHEKLINRYNIIGFVFRKLCTGLC
jgi:hypothetical protein